MKQTEPRAGPEVGGAYFQFGERVHVCDEVQQLANVLPHALHGGCCALRGATQIILEGRIAAGSRSGVSLFYWATSNKMPSARSDAEPYPRQRGDHVLLDDGGFRQPRADVCADKLRRRTPPHRQAEF